MKKVIRIGDKIIGEGRPCFIIAEVGINHNGRTHIAKSLVDAATQGKVDAVKFQKRNLKKLYRREILDNPSLGEQSLQYLIPILKEFELSDEDFLDIANYCKEKEIMLLCTPWDKESADFLNRLNVPAFKVASADLTNFDLLEHLIAFDKPLLVSTGMSSFEEIKKTVNFLKEAKTELVLLHCNSSYPAPFHNINLNFMKRMAEEFGVLVGYSGHELGIAVSEAAVVMGACVVERHITLDRTMRGPDHAASLEPQGIMKLVRNIRNIERSLGQRSKWLTRGEYINREALGKSLIAGCAIGKGTVITREMLTVKSPGRGISPQRIYELVGTVARRGIQQDEEFLDLDFPGAHSKKKKISFSKKWGVIARFTDMDTLNMKGLAIFEFHLSDQDLKSDVNIGNCPQELIVHAPEYWGDYLLDPASGDARIRSLTVDTLNRVISLAKRLTPHFKGSLGKKVKIIIHPGGMSRDRKPQAKEGLYQNLLWTLQELQSEEVEVLLENMPPLPCHFGGQWHHNFFVLPKEIEGFLKKSGYSICFDISHAKLGSNYFGVTIDDYFRLLPFTKHIHIADAAGIDGEGLQIGEGEIDFRPILSKISDLGCGFVPEIWQGHKFGGEGYWKAIERLEKLFR